MLKTKLVGKKKKKAKLVTTDSSADGGSVPPFRAGAADALGSRVDPVSGFQARQM